MLTKVVEWYKCLVELVFTLSEYLKDLNKFFLNSKLPSAFMTFSEKKEGRLKSQRTSLFPFRNL